MERILDHFDAAWNEPTPPCIEDYLAKADPDKRLPLLIELVRIDLERRLAAGERVRLEDTYLRRFPELSGDSPALVSLLKHEYAVRRRNEPDLRPREYLERFPQCQTGLLAQLPTLDEIPTGDPQQKTADTDAPAGLDLRGYELMEALGKGGMGEVYRCIDPALGRDLAIKIMKAEYNGHPQAAGRFLREARVTGSLQHPGIVSIHNLGRLSDSRLHYTMRLVRGRTFADILKDEAGKAERLPYLLAIFEKICQAVAYAHSKRVIHRDLKPQNVMVGKFGEVQVMDWGLAKLLTPGKRGGVSAPKEEDATGTRIVTEADTPADLSRMGSSMGTPAYMPPEQALGEWDNVDERADVFALGSILCDILTGQPAYCGTDGNEVYRRARRGDVTEALQRLQQCGADEALTALCRECLRPQREERPRDAAVLAKRVAEYQAEVQERLRRAEVERAEAQLKAREARKQRRLLIALVLALLIGGSLIAWQAVRAIRAEAEALDNERKAVSERDEKETARAEAVAAAEAERLAKDSAQARLGELAKSNELLASIFRDLDPRAEEKGGPNLRQQLSQHLERAAKKLDETAIGDAVAVALLQFALGTSLNGLGNAGLAVELLSKAGAALETKLGPEHPDTLISRNNLANAYRAAGRTADAIRLYEQILKRMEVKLGTDHADTLTSRNNLALSYLDAGRTAEAIRLYEKSLKQMEAKLGIEHPYTLTCRSNLAIAYFSAGRTAEAIRLNEQTLKQREAILGPEHPDTLISRNNLGEVCWSAGRTADAIRLFEQTLKQMEAKLGPEHPTTLTCRNNLALTYSDVGRTTEAIRLHEQILNQREAKLGTDHPDTLTSRNNLVSTYWSAGRTADAIRLCEQTLKQMEAKLGAEHPTTLTCRNNLAEAYLSADRTAEGIRLHEQTLKEREATLGTNHPDTLASRNNLAGGYFAAGRTAEAIRLFEQTLKQMETKLGTDHPSTLTSRDNLAEAYRDIGRTAEAIRLYEPNLKMREAKLGPEHPDTLTSRNNLAEAYRIAGRTAEAIRLHEQTLKQREAKLGTDHLDTLVSRNNLALTYWSAGRNAEALRLHEQTLKQREAKLGLNHPATLTSRSNLALTYSAAGRTNEAIRLNEQTLKQRQAKLGPDNPDTILSMANLALTYRDAARFNDAIPLLEAALERCRKRPGGFPARLTWIPNSLAATYDRAGQFVKAEAIYRDALEQERRQFGPEDPRTAGRMATLGLNLLHQHKYSDAEPLLRDCLKVRSAKVADDWRTFNARSLLGAALLGQKKYTEAEPLLLQGYEGMKARETKIPTQFRKIRLTEALQRLVQLYDATEQKEKAADWQKKLQETKDAQSKPTR